MSEPLERYLAAVADGDRTAALTLVRELLATGWSALEVMADLVAVTQRRVGELWASDDWSVAREHAATAVSESVLAVLAADIPVPTSTESPVVVACVEQEWHALPALLVAEQLRSAGVPVSYLGANASAEHLVRHVHEVGPRAVALSCSLAASLPRVRRHIESVRGTGTPVLVGGSAFDAEGRRAHTLGATAYAPSGSAAAQLVRTLPRAVTPAPPLDHPGAGEGLAVYADREEITARLRRRVLVSLPPAGDDVRSRWMPALVDHLPHLVGALAAALVSGDPAVLEDACAWLEEVMTHRRAPEGLVEHVREELGAELREHPHAARLLEA